LEIINASDLNEINILVLGDIMLDHYIYGECNRISPEAPVPIVEVRSEKFELGGAGNVLKNLKAFGCKTKIICVVGQDDNANLIFTKLSEFNLKKEALIEDASRCTTLKTRVLVNKHQLIRLDREIVRPIDTNIEEKVINALVVVIDSYQTLLISDYNKGMLTASLLKKVFDLCRKQNIKTIVDPKGTDFSKYRGADVIKPNKKEASLATGIAIHNRETLLEACIKIKRITECEAIVITMSEEGIALFVNEELTIIPTKALDVVDVTGAGDTVLASLGLALACGRNLKYACDFANHAAAVVVSKVGSATATIGEINKKFNN
jgi:rfaE bifunctional protein kinase chain/domain